jgi:hypothetical protein
MREGSKSRSEQLLRSYGFPFTVSSVMGMPDFLLASRLSSST